MKILLKFNQRYGFTPVESRVILILVSTFIVGIGIKGVKSFYMSTPEYDYKSLDSAFIALSDTQNFVTARPRDSGDNRMSTPNKVGISIININQATKDDLLQLPGVGDTIAERIVSYRNRIGRFKSIKELMHVHGIGKKKFEKIESLVTTGADNE